MNDFFKNQKTAEIRKKAISPIFQRTLSPEPIPLASTSSRPFGQYQGRSPVLPPTSRRTSQSSFDPDHEYQVDETIYYQPKEVPPEIKELEEEDEGEDKIPDILHEDMTENISEE